MRRFMTQLPLERRVSPLLSQAGTTKGTDMQELNIKKIAKACHEVNRAYCLALSR